MTQRKTPSLIIMISICLTINYVRSIIATPLWCLAMHQVWGPKSKTPSPKLFASQPQQSSLDPVKPLTVTQHFLLWKNSLFHFTALQSPVCRWHSTLLSKRLPQKLKSNLFHTTKWLILWISVCQVSLIASFLSSYFICLIFHFVFCCICCEFWPSTNAWDITIQTMHYLLWSFSLSKKIWKVIFPYFLKVIWESSHVKDRVSHACISLFP